MLAKWFVRCPRHGAPLPQLEKIPVRVCATLSRVAKLLLLPLAAKPQLRPSPRLPPMASVADRVARPHGQPGMQPNTLPKLQRGTRLLLLPVALVPPCARLKMPMS